MGTTTKTDEAFFFVFFAFYAYKHTESFFLNNKRIQRQRQGEIWLRFF